MLAGGIAGAGLLAAGGWYFIARRRVPQAREVMQLEGHVGTIQHVALSPDEPLVLSAGDDGTARVWGLSDGRLMRILTGHTKVVTRGAFVPNDRRRVLTASLDETVRLWDLDTGRADWVFDQTKKAFTALGVSPDGQRVMAGGPKAVDLEVSTGGMVWERSVGSKGASWVGWSPDSQLAAAGSGEVILVWPADGNHEGKRLAGHPLPIEVAGFSADGRRMAAGGVGRTATVWDVPSGAVVARYGLPHRLYRVVPAGNDGFEFVLHGDDDPRLTVYDPAAGRAVAEVVSPAGVLWGCEITQDFKRMVTGGIDGVVRVWELPG